LLSRGNVWEFQLAKGAVAAGIRMLVNPWGAGPVLDPAPRVNLAWALGNYVSLESGRRVRVLDCPEAHVTLVGNTTLPGAKHALLGKDRVAFDQQDLLARVEHVSLASDPSSQKGRDPFRD
jgi:uncharacterized 2Fe-2S/4Fe-4S cluster protein (DUF4445 family)